MSGLDLLRASRRHPIVLACCLLATMLAAGGIFYGLPVSYQAQTSLVLLAPNVVVDANGKTIVVNPWAEAGGNSAQVFASAMATIAGSKQFQDGLTSAGVTSKTTVAVSLAGGGVVLDAAAVNKIRDRAAADLQVLVVDLRAALHQRQQSAGAPANSYLRAEDLTGSSDPSPQRGSRTKLVGVAMVLGLIITMITVVGVDSRTRRKGGRRRAGGPKPQLDPDATATILTPPLLSERTPISHRTASRAYPTNGTTETARAGAAARSGD